MMNVEYDENPSQAQKDIWARKQSELKLKLIEVDDLSFTSHEKDGTIEFQGLRYIGGVDVSFLENNDQEAVASLVVLEYPSLEVIYEDFKMIKLKLPYIAGYLAFREVDPLLELLDLLKQNNPFIYPQIIFVDGNGTLHPRRFGLACHLGVLANIPTIGGDYYFLQGDSGIIWGAAVRSLESTTNPIYVSVGHRVCLETALRLVLKCCHFRIPEPTRQADIRSREFIRKNFPNSS
ncbi:hypothetical protein Glove_346g34 [Diversispora epigaea]|uniref:Endonuclease V n=1 Tax=Diversispora epigaea TaxID=1348612 RepID=A0A397HFI1_9GLOM|nr:hypothetical protein Glove_346g34 [Diversispora epigaea]